MKRALLSSALALLSGLVLLPITALLFTAAPANMIALAAACILSVGVSLWRPIRPVVFGFALAVAQIVIPLAVIAVAGATNLSGLVVIISGACGLLTGGSAAALGSWLRTRNLPRWIAPGAVAAAAVIFLVALGWSKFQQFDDHARMISAMEKIRHAEDQYAVAAPNHSFTCNGPDLPGFQTADWRTDPQMEEVGIHDRSQIQVGTRIIYLRCDPSPRRYWVDIVAKNLYSGYEEARARIER